MDESAPTPITAQVARERRVRDLFDALVDSDPGAWIARLEELEANAEIRGRAIQMLRLEQELRSRPLDGRDDANRSQAARPTQLDEFRLLEELGHGGMGTVYLADDVLLKRQVAVKLLSRACVSSDRDVARLRREAQVCAKLDDPRIVKVHRFGVCDGSAYLAMEFVNGTTLAEFVDADAPRLPQADALRMVCDVATALSHAHAAGIIHRDVKPSNVLVDQQRNIKLSDFGLAEALDPMITGSYTTSLFGSLRYMSPERLNQPEEPSGPQSDIFALGVIMYELLSGRHPFAAHGTRGMLANIIRGDYLPLRSVMPSCSDSVETVCNGALAGDPRNRYQSATDFATDLASLIADTPSTKALTMQTRRSNRLISRRKVLISLGTAGASAALAGWLWTRRDDVQTGIQVVSLPRSGRASIVRIASDGDRDDSFVSIEVGKRPVALEPGRYRVRINSVGGSLEIDQVVAPNEVSLVDATPQGLDPARPGMVLAPSVIDGPDSSAAERAFARRYAHIDSLLIDEFEVTNTDYAAFIAATGHQPPEHWGMIAADPSTFGDRPCVGVTYADASAYATWCGKRLPSASEWTFAATHADGRKYPWGDTPSVHFEELAHVTNAAETDSAASDVELTVAEQLLRIQPMDVMRNSPDVNAIECVGMLTNVANLTCSRPGSDGRFGPDVRIAMGNHWQSRAINSLRDGSVPSRLARILTVGFRCVAPV